MPAEILLILKPLLIEMEQFREDLDVDEFIESSLALLKTVSIDSRNLILNFNRRPVQVEKHKFRPEISQISRELAEHFRQKISSPGSSR